MKKMMKKSVLTVLAILVNVAAFAQGNPGDFGGSGDSNPTDAPISDYIWVLAVVGLIYVFYKMKNKIQVAK